VTSQALNTALVELSKLETSINQLKVSNSCIEDGFNQALKSSNKPVSSLSIQSPVHPAKHIVYIPVVEQRQLQEDRERALQMVLVEHDCYQFDSEKELRNEIVRELDKLVKQWVRSEGLSQYMTWNQVEQAGGKVVCYGSFRLCVVDNDSDLDLLCVIPRHVTSEAFFSRLYEQLRKKEEITELRKLPAAFVPVIKMRYRGIDVDLTMSRLMASDKVPEEEELLLNSSTRDMDQTCLRSLNGYKATCEIEELVPCMDKFRLTLRFIKLWAKKNGLYGNMLGFLGGASWAILVAKVCQLAGVEGMKGSSAILIHRFFYTFANWNWPEPVYIKAVANQPYNAWNPLIHPQDREHAMPIITSSLPQMNSAVNVSKPNCQLITKKCAEAFATCQGVLEGVGVWPDLFQANFFEEFDSFILISGICRGDSELWFGSIESKLRELSVRIAWLENVSTVRVWPQPFKREGHGLQQMWFFGLRMVVGEPPESIQEPLHIFSDLCMDMASKLYSPHSSTFHVHWEQLPRAQLPRFLTKTQLGTEVPQKLSYAAVAQGCHMTSPVMVSSMQSMTCYTSSVPLASPTHVDPCHVPPPYTRVFPSHHLPGVDMSWSNYIVYSTGAQPQHPVLPQHSHSLAHPSLQPVGYPVVYSRGPMSPPVTAEITSMPRPSPSYPPPSSAHQPAPHTSYPPPPFSPISQFRSPPPPIPQHLQPPQDSCSSKRAVTHGTRMDKKKQKESVADDSERLRSVSCTSDKFPPASLNLARVTHQDQLPLSPSYTMSGVVPLPSVDTSVPPPSLPTSPVSMSPASASVSFNHPKKILRAPRTPRVSVSEISDMVSPKPVKANKATTSNIKYYRAE